MKKAIIIFAIFFLYACSHSTKNAPPTLSADITPHDIRAHISFLNVDSLGNRELGTPEAARAARYISDQLEQFGLQPAGDDSTYYQEFIVDMGDLGKAVPDSMQNKKRLSRNVVAKIEGIHQPDTYTIIDAPYNYFGVPNNASGVSGVMEIAQYFSVHKPGKSLLFIAFSGDGRGRFGVQHFVNHPLIPLNQVQAVINLNNIGGLKQNALTISGVGTSKRWASLIKKANKDSLSITTISGGVDQTGFYDKGIPILNYTTDTSSGDVNAVDETRILRHLKELIMELDTLPASHLSFNDH